MERVSLNGPVWRSDARVEEWKTMFGEKSEPPVLVENEPDENDYVESWMGPGKGYAIGEKAVAAVPAGGKADAKAAAGTDGAKSKTEGKAAAVPGDGAAAKADAKDGATANWDVLSVETWKLFF